jgi:hypothetical protein
VSRVLLVVGLLAVAACGPGGAPHPGGAGPSGWTASTAHRPEPPPANAGFDYQIGEAYPPPAGARVITRDRAAEPVPGRYTVCYVNAFQAQPEELGWWRAHHRGLLLHDRAGAEVVDRDWNEVLLDISTADRRTAVAAVVDRWLDGCATRGFRAVEPDNLDSWTRSGGLLDRDDATRFARLLTDHAHARGLAVGQKNTPELAGTRRSTGFDFAVAEECGRYDECDTYTDAYGAEVFVIEYRRRDFTTACRRWGPRLSIVFRDRSVSAPSTPGYRHAAC